MTRRDWTSLPGIDQGTWDYLKSSWIAQRYADYFANHPLFETDQTILNEAFGSPERNPVIADFGCGNGRALLPLIERGFSGLAIDLSEAMLREVQTAAQQRGVPVTCVQANLVELDGITSGSCAHGMCLFSTLGMIKGRPHRRRALSHFRRIISPTGTLVLHVHNYWYNLWDPGGPWWLIGNRIRSFCSQRFGDRSVERGDKHYPYRGLQKMFLHVFTQRELQDDLAAAGWSKSEFIPLRPQSLQRWDTTAIAKGIRTPGWIIICR